MENDDRSDPPPSGDPNPPVPLDTIPLHSTNLLTVLDEKGVIRYESPSIERIFGFEPATLVGDQVAEYFHPGDRQQVVQAFERVVDSGEYTIEAVEYRHKHANGSYVWVESVASSNPTPEGYYIVNTRDITVQKARERELERTNARLEEFATVVSHDLRNPLSVAAGRLELVREDCSSEHLDAIKRAHQRIDELIDDVLALARVGKTVGDTGSVAVSEIAETSWQAIAAPKADIELESNTVIEADESACQQLFENLFRNAVEHGGEGITITVGDLADGFFVEDDGPGIPEENRTAVLEPGYSTSSNGTGFGLNIVQDIASAHGWKLHITSSSEGGARFEFSNVETK